MSLIGTLRARSLRNFIPSSAIEQTCTKVSREQGIRAAFFEDAWIRERVGIKRAITGGGVPPELVKDFEGLWQACVGVLK